MTYNFPYFVGSLTFDIWFWVNREPHTLLFVLPFSDLSWYVPNCVKVVSKQQARHMLKTGFGELLVRAATAQFLRRSDVHIK